MTVTAAIPATRTPPEPQSPTVPEPVRPQPTVTAYRTPVVDDEGEPCSALVYSRDERWSYRRIYTLGQPLRITHRASGLHVDYAHPYITTSQAVDEVASGRAAGRILAQAVALLADPNTTRKLRTAAVITVVELDGVAAWCACGGLLHYAADGMPVHINVCGWCLDRDQPDACVNRTGHQLCDRPATAQCEHNPCRAGNVFGADEQCGCDKRCCGRHA